MKTFTQTQRGQLQPCLQRTGGRGAINRYIWTTSCFVLQSQYKHSWKVWLDLSSGGENQPQPRQTAQNKDPTSKPNTSKEGADHRGEQGGKSESQSPLAIMSQELSHNSSPTSQDAARGCSLSSSPLSTPSSSAAPSRSPSSTSGLSSGFLPSPSQSTKAILGLLGTTKRTSPLQLSTRAHPEFSVLQVQRPSSVTSRAQ